MKAYREYLSTVALIWAACLIVFVFIYLILLGPQRRLRKLTEKQAVDKSQMYESAMLAGQDQAQEALKEQINELRKRYKDFVVDFEDCANLTFDISRIAGEHKITSFSIKSQEKGGISAIPDCDHICENRIDFSCTAEFNQFAAFLNALERHHPVLFVDKFTITRAKQNEAGPQVSLNLAALVTKPRESWAVDSAARGGK